MQKANDELELRVQQRTAELTQALEQLQQEMLERQQAEDELRQSEGREREKATQLEAALYQLRTAQAQLIQSEKMSSLGQLVAGVAHELNNPVNFIHGNLTHVNNYASDLLDLIHLYYAIATSPPPQEETNAEPLSHTLNRLNQTIITMSETPKYDFSGASFSGIVGSVTGDIKGDNIGTQHIYAPEQKQNLAEAAAEIQQLLKQLEQTNSTTTETEKQVVVAEGIKREIKRNPTLRDRLRSAIKAGGTEALKAIFDDPLVSIPIETIKGWIEAE